MVTNCLTPPIKPYATPYGNIYIAISMALFLLILLQACNPPNTTTLPSSTGKQGEIIVSLENRFKNSTMESAIGSVLGEEHPALPQPEALFSYSIVPRSAFSGLLKVHQCIMIVELGSNNKNAVSIQKNVWAKPQIVVRVTGKSDETIRNALINNRGKIQQAFLSFEFNLNIKKHRSIADKNLQKSIRKKFNISLDIPKGFLMANSDTNFIWMREETPETSLGLLLHTYNYSGSDSLTANSVLEMRNHITKKFVPGPSDGSHMSTMMEFPVVGKDIFILGRPALELRGLWNVEGDFMGGPFVSYAILDTNSNQILYLEGFAYAPKYNKRNYVKRLEAILLSLSYD